jgi:hypothetical protein
MRGSTPTFRQDQNRPCGGAKGVSFTSMGNVLLSRLGSSLAERPLMLDLDRHFVVGDDPIRSEWWNSRVSRHLDIAACVAGNGGLARGTQEACTRPIRSPQPSQKGRSRARPA